MTPFFIEIQNFLPWADKLGHLGYFQPNYQHSFWYSEFLVHVFIIQSLFLQKELSLYIHIPNIHLGL